MRAAQLETAAQNGAALDGESFIRPHLRELAAYTPIGEDNTELLLKPLQNEKWLRNSCMQLA